MLLNQKNLLIDQDFEPEEGSTVAVRDYIGKGMEQLGGFPGGCVTKDKSGGLLTEASKASIFDIYSVLNETKTATADQGCFL